MDYVEKLDKLTRQRELGLIQVKAYMAEVKTVLLERETGKSNPLVCQDCELRHYDGKTNGQCWCLCETCYTRSKV